MHASIDRGTCLQDLTLESRFNRTVRYEWLAQFEFDTIAEVQGYATAWMWSYTHEHERPNMALGGISQKQRLAMAALSLLLAPTKSGGITVVLGQPLPDANTTRIRRLSQSIEGRCRGWAHAP